MTEAEFDQMEDEIINFHPIWYGYLMLNISY
jgi:hypothetical protein